LKGIDKRNTRLASNFRTLQKSNKFIPEIREIREGGVA
jgi:hypothetical protein